MGGLKLFIILLSLLLAVMPIYAATFLVQPSPLQANTEIDYTLNFTSDAACTNVLLENYTTVTTNANGVAYIDVDVRSLATEPLYLCEYRDWVLRKVHANISLADLKLAKLGDRMTGNLNMSDEENITNANFLWIKNILSGITSAINVFSSMNFTDSQNITNINFAWIQNLFSGTPAPIQVLSNLNLTSGNVTAKYYFGNGSLLTDVIATNYNPNITELTGKLQIVNTTDLWVNSTGDSMTGNLNMSNIGNITNINKLFIGMSLDPSSDGQVQYYNSKLIITHNESPFFGVEGINGSVPRINFFAADGDASGNRILTAANNIGTLQWWAYNGTVYRTVANIRTQAREAFGGNITGSMEFTTAAPSGSLTERMRINSTGAVTINTTTADDYLFAVRGKTRLIGDLNMSNRNITDIGAIRGAINWIRIATAISGTTGCDYFDNVVAGWAYTCAACVNLTNHVSTWEGGAYCGDTNGARDCACKAD